MKDIKQQAQEKFCINHETDFLVEDVADFILAKVRDVIDGIDCVYRYRYGSEKKEGCCNGIPEEGITPTDEYCKSCAVKRIDVKDPRLSFFPKKINQKENVDEKKLEDKYKWCGYCRKNKVREQDRPDVECEDCSPCKNCGHPQVWHNKEGYRCFAGEDTCECGDFIPIKLKKLGVVEG